MMNMDKDIYSVSEINRYVKEIIESSFDGQIVVEGEINADIQTENLYLKSSGIVDGEITYRNIIIDSGGLLKSNMVQNISSLNNLIKLNKS